MKMEVIFFAAMAAVMSAMASPDPSRRSETARIQGEIGATDAGTAQGSSAAVGA